MDYQRKTLPVYEVIPSIKEALSSHNSLVLQAPPGAGKTTCVPLELLTEKWLCNGKIIMLEPRRIAARSAARRMAKSLGEKVGDVVGYSVHLDSRTSEKTRIEVVTEGVFLRRLLNDPELQGVSLVIFDEFHERNLESDLSLAMVKESFEVLRPDLKLLVMSATLDGEPISEYLGDAPLITSEGRVFPVEVQYRPDRDKGGLVSHIVSTVLFSLDEHKGSILVFLPGVGEINRVYSLLTEKLSSQSVEVLKLHGSLKAEEQEKAIEPVEEGKRKVVLATSIAESSITIKGIRLVIDSGLVRKPRFNPRTAMDSLETLQVSKASADQRTGRAGRVEEGICLRLWDQSLKLDEFSEPGILTEDLSGAALSLALWGRCEIDSLQWLTEPNRSIFNGSRDLLCSLGALDQEGITERGKNIARLPLHPRLGAMMLVGEEQGEKSLVCDMAAILSERDFLSYSRENFQADLRLRLEGLKGKAPYGAVINRAGLSRVKEYSASMKRGSVKSDDSQAGSYLLFAYPDRIARNRGNGLFQLVNGSDAVLPEWDVLYHEEYLVIPSLGGTGPVSKIFMACPVSKEEIFENCKAVIRESENLVYIRDKKKFSAYRQFKIGHLTLKEEQIRNISSERFAETLCAYLKAEGLSELNWNRESLSFRDRVCFLNRQRFSGFPDLSDEAMMRDMSWLEPFLSGFSFKSSLSEIPLLEALKSLLDWSDLKELDRLAPSHITVPSGSKLPIDYSENEPVLKVRLQELFGLTETPTVGGGKIALILHLLSPASRPIQVTRDLKSFWKNTYFDVKKDLMGRYPKHYWPDDPLKAEPTNRAKRRKP